MNSIAKNPISRLACCAALALLACREDSRLPSEAQALSPSLNAVAGTAVWSLFGDAAAVRQGTPPNPWAIRLSSEAAGFAGVDFHPPAPVTFAEITQLSADFNVTNGDCGGGSPRFQLGLDRDGDGNFDGNIFVHFGPSPNFTGCSAAWQDTGNLIGNNDVGRYDASQVGGSGFGTYQQAHAVAGTFRVLSIQLVVDGSWFFGGAEQTVLVDNVLVNQHRLTAPSLLR